MSVINRFKDLYKNEIVKNLKTRFSYSNPHQIPKLSKIVINMGVGDVVNDSKIINNAISDLTLISGQKPYVTHAKRSIAAFKLRKGMKLGCKVTLRGDRMYDFLERFVIVALPRVKGFNGFSSKSFDGSGNFTFGVKEHIVFPEIDYDKVSKVMGMDITIVTTSSEDEVSKSLLKGFMIPFHD